MTTSSTTLSVRISGAAMSTIEGSELYYDAVKYAGASSPDLPAAEEAVAGLRASERRRAGKGWSYVAELSPAAAAVVEHYCRTVGETFAEESEPDIRAEGRALLVVADRIVKLLEPRG